MGFWDFLTGNKVKESNGIKIARVKKEMQFMSREQKVDKLKKLPKNLYTKTIFESIGDIYEYSINLSFDFIMFYLIFSDESIREEVEEAAEEEVDEVDEVNVIDAVMSEVDVFEPTEEVSKSSYVDDSCDDSSD